MNEYIPDAEIVFSDRKLPPHTDYRSLIQYIYDNNPDLQSNKKWLKTFGKELVRPIKKHQFIRIGLENTYDLGKLKKIITSKLKYKYLDKAYLIVESFSGKDNKKNLHVHILKEDIYSKTKIIRDLANKFQIAPNFVEVQKGEEVQVYEARLAYMKGEKKDQNKVDNVVLDREWRKQNDIKDIYVL